MPKTHPYLLLVALAPLPSPTQQPQTRTHWTDPTTGLMWTARDNGKDVSWAGAIRYCRNLHLDGYADWRLANMFELQHLFDIKANSPGLAGPHDSDPTTWHIRGDIFLTGYQWAARVDGKSAGGYAYYFDFNEGKSNDQPTGILYSASFMRALCIRGSGDPLGRP